MDKLILSILVWVFFLGGLFGMVIGVGTFVERGRPAAEYLVMGIGGGFWLLSCAIVIYIRKRIEAS
jgi:hypothetical protein